MGDEAGWPPRFILSMRTPTNVSLAMREPRNAWRRTLDGFMNFYNE